MSLETRWQSIYETAGYLAAHAVWHLHEEDIVIPVLAYEAQGQRIIEEILANTMAELETGIGKASVALATNPMAASFALLIFPASIELNQEARTCIVIDMCDYASELTSSARLVVPFTLTKKNVWKRIGAPSSWADGSQCGF